MAKAGPELAALCTACGACFNACPMVDHLGLRAADPRATTDDLRRLAVGEPGSGATVSWTGDITLAPVRRSQTGKASGGAVRLGSASADRKLRQDAANASR